MTDFFGGVSSVELGSLTTQTVAEPEQSPTQTFWEEPHRPSARTQAQSRPITTTTTTTPEAVVLEHIRRWRDQWVMAVLILSMTLAAHFVAATMK